MQKHIILLRMSYWIPALADFAIAYRALSTEVMGTSEIVYPMGLVSAIAFSWGVMLLIADRKPIERRWILIPTILVVGLLTVVRFVFSQVGAIESSMVFLLFGIGLVLFMTYSLYFANRKIA